MENADNGMLSEEQVILVMDQASHNSQPSTQNHSFHASKHSSENDSFNTTTTTRTLRRLNFSKPKSRFVEIPHLTPLKTTLLTKTPPQVQEPSPTKPFFSSDDDEEEDEHDDDDDEDDDDDDDPSKEDYDQLNARDRRKKRKIGRRATLEFAALVSILSCLVCSLIVVPLARKHLWDIILWKWCLIILVTFSGRLVSAWLVGAAVFLIERYFMLREKVLYFVYGLRRSVQKCVWLGLVLLAWFLMFDHEVKAVNKPKYHELLDKLWRALVAVMVGACIWLLKILLVKVLASSFHVATFFDRMKESVFHHYILEALSGPPIEEEKDNGGVDARLAEKKKRKGMGFVRRSKTMPARMNEGGLGASRRIDMERLKRLSRQKASGWSVRRLVSQVMASGPGGLSTISRTVDLTAEELGEMSSEWEARLCAHRIFKHVAKDGHK
ncbi:hypothetical protein ACLOJK_034080 [Asimina triloba]